MRRSSKLALIAIAAIAAAALFASSATARTRIEVSTTAFLMLGRLTFGTELGTVICDVTFHATLRRLINKIRLEHVGDITSVLTANARNESGGLGGCDYLPPMRIAYGSISGTLPTITGAEFQFAIGVLWRCIFSECLYFGLSPFEANQNPIRTLTLGREPGIALFRALSEFCPSVYRYTGTMTVSPSFTVRLLER
jgi:hypothetical protein